MRFKPFLVISCLVISGCGENSKIQDAIRADLKDPESAKFGSIVVVNDFSGHGYACAIVNSKNSYGGYVGDKVATLIRPRDEWQFTGFSQKDFKDCVDEISEHKPLDLK